MIKKIAVTHLKPGMYVTNISQAGIDLHEHEREGRITQQNTIDQLAKRGVQEVFIDVSQGDDSEHAIDLETNDQKRDADLKQLSEPSPALQNPHQASVSFEKEFEKASKMHSEALNLVSVAMDAAKNGELIQIDTFEDMADNFMDSVVRNQNALACLSRIRDKDSYLMEHSVNVAVLMSILGKHLQLERTYLHQCVTGALLHDIGKILIPDSVLHKPGKLTNEEFAIMKRHSLYSRKILEKNKGFPQVAINVAAHHHERLDGKGYPEGLSGDEVSQEGRMASVVDVYDAITADRVYHKGMTPSAALKLMLEWCGPHLDKQFVHAFIKAIGVYPVGSLVELESGLAGVVMEETGNNLCPVIKIIYNLKQKSYCTVKRLDLSKNQQADKILRTLDPMDYGIKLKDFLS